MATVAKVAGALYNDSNVRAWQTRLERLGKLATKEKEARTPLEQDQASIARARWTH